MTNPPQFAEAPAECVTSRESGDETFSRASKRCVRLALVTPSGVQRASVGVIVAPSSSVYTSMSTRSASPGAAVSAPSVAYSRVRL